MDNVTYRLAESAVATLRQLADAADLANELTQKVLENQEKSLANMDQLKKTSQQLELNLIECPPDYEGGPI